MTGLAKPSNPKNPLLINLNNESGGTRSPVAEAEMVVDSENLMADNLIAEVNMTVANNASPPDDQRSSNGDGMPDMKTFLRTDGHKLQPNGEDVIIMTNTVEVN